MGVGLCLLLFRPAALVVVLVALLAVEGRVW